MESRDRRNSPRLPYNFPVQLSSRGKAPLFGGITVNLSQDGALVRTQGWPSFQVDDQALITILLPATFTGHDAAVGLRGTATVIRIDQANEGVALRFGKRLRQFDRV